MPKYYRFRATTPTRKSKRYREKEKEGEVEKVKSVAERSWQDVTLACTPAPYWYMRRTSWRACPPLMGLPREVAAGLRASVHLSNRPIFVFKIPQEAMLRPL
ncbi:hypothetical protein evm_009894 [Chilo suppressalis]|nr:hypothetical protein evm_009894 [Chilo suppressalis]